METSSSEIKELVAQYLVGNLRASSTSKGSIITLPIKTIDDRWVSVIIEKKHDYFLVHDAGKSDAELFSQGVQMSEEVEQFNAAIAARYGVEIKGRIIQKLCKIGELPETLMAVAESAAVMTAQLVSQLVEIEGQAVRGRVSEALQLWKPEDFEIEENSQVEGTLSSYTLNFVAKAQSQMHMSAAINILPRSNNNYGSVKYALMLLDLKATPSYKDLMHLAVILGADNWSERSLELVNKVADKTMEVTPATQGQVESGVRQMLTVLTATRPAPPYFEK